MLAKRIIPCLDVDRGRVVKGINFINLVDTGDPVTLAKFYNDEGADELVFLDITASSDNRETMIDIVKKVAKKIFIPFTVGGGINNLEQARKIINAGAEKVSLNTAAVKNPKLITEVANNFGNQCVVLAIDAKKIGNSWKVFVKGGRENTELDVIEWAKKGASLGAGEILLTSMDQDGTKSGYDIELTKTVSESVNIPIIASGGAGKLQDFSEVLTEGKADAALAASLFHFGAIKIGDLKTYLKRNNITVRIKEPSPRRRGSKNMQLNFEKGNGLIPAIIQDLKSGEVLMLGFMNEEAFIKTNETSLVHFYSRTRKKLWMKGEDSGDKLEVMEIFTDCDKDTILVKVKMLGKAVCHTGKKSCFFEKL